MHSCLRGWYSAQEFGVEGWAVEERILLSEDRVQVACRALPMGFSWSLYFAHTINEAKAAEATRLSKETLSNDSLLGVVLDARESPNPQTLHPQHRHHSTGPVFEGSTQVGRLSFQRSRAVMHEVETHQSSAERVGIHLDLDQHQTGPLIRLAGH